MTLDADERTLRRAVARGAVRGERVSGRRLAVSDEERDYLAAHWGLLSDLQRALRTEPNVRLAVLYGSSARGDDVEGSDVDLLVSFRDRDPGDGLRLATRLGRTLGRQVDVASLAGVERRSPLLLLQVLNEGRVLVDRDGIWEELRSRRGAIRQRSRRARRRQRERAARALSSWLAEG